ncbi:MAG TPA: hypothetical protein VFS05_08710 [Gemmatimonadaceae bacterium]|nr:hypothetical protein [Gemmatimonadaceae bacterium]
MRLARRITACIATLLLVQLSLVASGYGCALHALARSHATSAMAAMSGMAHGAHGAMHTTASVSAPDDAPPAGTPASCDMPWAHGGCDSMASCAPAALPDAPLALVAPPPAHTVPVAAATAPPGRALVPELPPPRA